MKKTKFALIALLSLNLFTVSAQNQIGVVKKLEWNSISSFDSRYGSKVNIGNSVSMIVNVPKADFAVVTIDDQMSQKWLTPLTGFPMAIGKFKNNILVIAASDRSFFKSFTNIFKAILLDEKTGKILSDKTIYQGSDDYVEAPDFFFAKDGSYFKMASRLTAMKRKVHIGLPLVGALSALKMEKDYKATVNYTMIDFNDRLEQIQKTTPVMPKGDSWNAYCGEDGSLMISAIDKVQGKCNLALYLTNNPEPLKIISIPVDFYKNGEVTSINFASSKTPLVNYFAFVYKDASKEQSIFVSKIDFKGGTFAINKEVLSKEHIKELQKSFIPTNKKFDELQFDNISSMDIRHLEEYNDKLLLTLSPEYTIMYNSTAISYSGSILINVYNQNVNLLYHQFVPRDYRSITGEGSEVAFNLKENNLRILANHKDGGNSVATIYSEMDLNTGKILKINLIPKDNIKGAYYASTNAISWFKDSFIVPYLAHQGMFSKQIDVQLLQLSY